MTLPLKHRGFSFAHLSSVTVDSNAPVGPSPVAETTAVMRQLLKRVGRLLILAIALIGLGTVYDEVIGDGTLPHLNQVAAIKPVYPILARQNTTQSLSTPLTAPEAGQALSPSRNLLIALSPEIGAWLYDLHQQGHIVYTEPAESLTIYSKQDGTETIAAYRHLNGTLYIGKTFWRLSDGQKAAVLAHEYRHFRQNLPKRISRQLAQLAGAGHFDYQSPIEEEAFAYERQALSALGL